MGFLSSPSLHPIFLYFSPPFLLLFSPFLTINSSFSLLYSSSSSFSNVSDLHDYTKEARAKTQKMVKDKVLDPSMLPWMAHTYGYEPP
jgi:hypothetical protein